MKTYKIVGDNVESYSEEAKKAAKKFKAMTGHNPDKVEIIDVDKNLALWATSRNGSEIAFEVRGGRMYTGNYNIVRHA